MAEKKKATEKSVGESQTRRALVWRFAVAVRAMRELRLNETQFGKIRACVRLFETFENAAALGHCIAYEVQICF